MNPVKKILEKLNGLHYRQEYLCFAKESHTEPLHVYLVQDQHITKDITNQHLFTGYCPLIFVFPADNQLTESIQLLFSQKLLIPNEVFEQKDALAILEMKMIKKQVSNNSNIVYYEGSHVHHFLLNGFHQYLSSIYNGLYNKRPGNVFLHDNLYKQVQVAYAVPRIISLITVSNNNLFNLFPTDLHGQIDDEHYIISLRSNGKACKQVEATGKVLLSRMHCDAYKTVYGLGKNHMQELRTKEHFQFGSVSSKNLKLPIAEQAISYQELLLKDSFIHGIHRVFLFKIIFQQQLNAEQATLSHIHNCYATWRYKNKLAGNYLIR
ncbi:hypothetical protein BH11BAC4_BH11BAC4_07150 [soil metagenome]